MAPTINTGLTGAATRAMARLPAPCTNHVISRSALCHESKETLGGMWPVVWVITEGVCLQTEL